jgi:chorismate mutase/prephenate dehydratase|tara:strand:+ start:606 stop:953 length:348 start_codon:yes stop_codon:yes gene_type:complete
LHFVQVLVILMLLEEIMSLDELRAQINEIDADLLALINRRARCVVEIGEIKRRTQAAVLVPEREQELFARLVELNEGPISEVMLRQIFQEIINTLKVLQRPGKDSSAEVPELRVS